jgi:ABC-type nitrate/sulfonate/bicarbonate transport system substrate-binding protein
MRTRLLLLAAPALALVLTPFAAVSAAEPTKIKVAYLRSLPMIPHWHAEKMGLLKKEGIETEIVTLNTGPAVVAAVVARSADVGFTASVPMISARSQKQPIKVFASLNFERHGGPVWTWMMASERSGVKSLKELAGKTVAINAIGGGCELLVKEHLAKAGLPISAVKLVTLPFPQMPGALELGNADAACIIEPFRTAISLGGKIKPVTIAEAMLADLDQRGRMILDGFFAHESWIKGNERAAAAFMRAYQAAQNDLAKHPAVFQKYLVDEFKMTPALAAAIPQLGELPTTVAEPSEWQSLIDALNRAGMLPNPATAQDLIHQVRP